MDDKLVRQVFEELLHSLEALDTKCAAILQFLRNKGIASDDELAAYFEQAGNASSVRWRATRVRINHLLATKQDEDKDQETPSGQAKGKTAAASASEKSTKEDTETTKKDRGDVPKPADNAHESASNKEQRQTESASSAEQKEQGRKDNQSRRTVA